MRQIKFRALKDDMSNCNWMIGQLVYDVDGTPRITAPIDMSDTGRVFTFHSCIKGTEGQFTGLMDKNGKEIWEGDILASAWDTMLRLWLIEFSDGSFTNVNIGVDGYLGERFKLTQDKCSERVVVGNRFERPDLLK